MDHSLPTKGSIRGTEGSKEAESIVLLSGEEFLRDIDWKVTFVHSSSHVNTLNEPLLQVSLSRTAGKSILIELSQSELDQLLSTLNRAKEDFSQLRNS